ncbi:MAG: hypothetical protein RBR93_12430 [Aliarcobacter butzleri]|nr:hypothetical protein [Aliarcobacter butzleri]
MATGSNPVFGATSSQLPEIGTSSHFLQPNKQNYDTFLQKKDTAHLRLYKVNSTYYYRRRIKQKLIRISLKTKNIKIALKRKKVLDLLNEKEMFKLETADFKIMFEYDTEEELKIALENAMKMQIEAKVQRYKEVKEHLEFVEKTNYNDLTFEQLRDKFIASKRKDGKVGEKSIRAYNGTFNLLIKYFKNTSLNTLTINEFDKFKDYLINLKTSKNIKNKNINKHIMYTKYFVKFAVNKRLIASNEANGMTFLDELADEIARKKVIRNYTNDEVNAIINYEYDDPIYNKVFKILAYSGMRPSDLYSLKNEHIMQDNNGIYYFNIEDGKTLNSIRKVPIHNEILSDVLSTNFPLFNLTHDAIGKKVRRQLYKVIDEKSSLNLYTLRGTFIEKALALNIDVPNINPILQDCVGHDKGDKIKLTNDTYAKNLPMQTKQAVINRVHYND